METNGYHFSKQWREISILYPSLQFLLHALFFISNTVKIWIVGYFEISIVVAYFFPKIWHSCCLFQKFPIVVAYFEFCKNHDLISYLLLEKCYKLLLHNLSLPTSVQHNVYQ